jgi:hypothetical protein
LTANELLADLTRQGFRLDACEDRVGVEPASKLTESQRQPIRESKEELLALLKPATKPRSQPPRRRKSRIVHTPRSNTELSVREISAKPGPADQPKLCLRCRAFGYAICRECALQSEPGLVLGRDGVIYRVRIPPEPVVKGWHRCEVCGEPYEGVSPPFGRQKLCPKCFQSSKLSRKSANWPTAVRSPNCKNR